MEKPLVSVLAVDDEQTYLDLLKQALELEGYYVNTASNGLAAISMLQTLPFDIALLDIMMPQVDGMEVLKYVKAQCLDTEVIMLTGIQDVKVAVECMKNGAYYYITKPYLASDLLALIDRALERKRLVRHNTAFKTELARRTLSANIVGHSRALLETLDLASRAAPTDSTVLIQGASGTGKELVASFLHNNSARKDQPFMAINCSSIPETLLESELFGHEKGAFTDATTSKQGLVEIADGGTLFLDEIGEMPLTVQPKVLRFLQTGEFRRVGGNRNLKSNVRLISASNRDLRLEAAAKRFREDLLFRINVITLELPSLRERKDDIPMLVEHFLKNRAGNRQPKRLDGKVLEMLMRYDWPGNIRELENVIERAAVLSQDEMIYVDDLALPLGFRPTLEASSGKSRTEVRAGSAVSLAELQKVHVARVLESVRWSKELAAKILGVSVKTLYAKIQAYGLVEP